MEGYDRYDGYDGWGGCEGWMIIICNKVRMHKVGIMLMGKPSSTTSSVKEIVLEVEPKTKVKNLFEYLLEFDKILDTQVYIAVEKKGRPMS